MKAYLLSAVIVFLSVAVVACNASQPAETYWNEVLHRTPMPKAVRDSLDTEATGGVLVAGSKDGHKTGVTVGKGGTTVTVGGPKGKRVYVGVNPNPQPKRNPFDYRYAATDTQLHDDPHTAVFFQEKDLKPGNTMNLHFTPSTSPAPFLPRQLADSIPFSSAKLPEILARLSVAPGSASAAAIQTTIKDCEEKPIEGEDKHCATSLEGMVDYVSSKLGRHVSAVSTEVEMEEDTAQKYTVVEATRMGTEGSVVACHKQSYAYAVFYCHETAATRAYQVSLARPGGGKVEAVAVCHTDTARWNPRHLAFVVLKVKPGSVPVCHFLPEDHVVWVRK